MWLGSLSGYHCLAGTGKHFVSVHVARNGILSTKVWAAEWEGRRVAGGVRPPGLGREDGVP